MEKDNPLLRLSPQTKPIKTTIFILFKCHHQKATIQIHLMPLPRLSLPSVKGWAIFFHLEDSMTPKLILSTNKGKYNWLESPYCCTSWKTKHGHLDILQEMPTVACEGTIEPSNTFTVPLDSITHSGDFWGFREITD